MKTLLFNLLLCSFSFQLYSQQNCSNPIQLTICPTVCFANQTNAGMGDDAPSGCNLSGEDVLYEIYVPNGADGLFISITGASGPLVLTLQQDSCGNSPCNSVNTIAGNSNVSFTNPASAYYYLWVDASAAVTYDICFGADTATVFVNIPNTQGNLTLDSSVCVIPPFAVNKPFFQVSYNNIFQTNPMTLPLFTTGTLCITTFFKNLTGVEGVKRFSFTFNPLGYSSVAASAPIISGFYNTGNWFVSNSGNTWTYEFTDQAGTGRGDFLPPPDSCLEYTFCFNVFPISNDPDRTNVEIEIISDGYGAGFTGWVHQGCCPSTYSNCLPASVGSGNGGPHSFSFSFSDPAAPLPVELVKFDAEPKDGNILISWTTASEINNDYFTIERTETQNAWIEISKVSGAGNSSSLLSYNYIDKNPLSGVSFYRLKQTDYDGNFSFSFVREVRMKAEYGISVFPNPANSELIIRCPENKVETINITIFNAFGERFTVPSTMRTGEKLLNISGLPRGLYLIVIEGNGVLVKKERIVVHN
jgi:hypothetical protein